jgi:hypothetical protein
LRTRRPVLPSRSYPAFKAVREANHIAHGFRNADIRTPLFGDLKKRDKQRRASAAVGRLLKRLHVRHLVAKIPRTRRWRSPNAAGICSAWLYNSIAATGRNWLHIVWKPCDNKPHRSGFRKRMKGFHDIARGKYLGTGTPPVQTLIRGRGS